MEGAYGMNKDKIIYSINVEDVQTVAEEDLGRELTDDEVKFVEDKIGDYIDWFDTISLILNELNDEEKSLDDEL